MQITKKLINEMIDDWNSHSRAIDIFNLIKENKITMKFRELENISGIDRTAIDFTSEDGEHWYEGEITISIWYFTGCGNFAKAKLPFRAIQKNNGDFTCSVGELHYEY